jgi:hypothetical protein
MPSIVTQNEAQELLGLIRTEFRNLSLREILARPPRVLLGETPGAAAAMSGLGITTVFDLATSGLFDDATKIVPRVRTCTACSSSSAPRTRTLYAMRRPLVDR